MRLNKYNPFSPPNHSLKPKPKWEHNGQSRHERGYDNDWDKVRNAYIQANPLCEPCLDHKPKRIVKAAQVDHKIPFKGLKDPLRLDWSNLQSICISCHRRKEAIYRKQNKQ